VLRGAESGKAIGGKGAGGEQQPRGRHKGGGPAGQFNGGKAKVVQESGFDIESVLLFYGIFRKLVIRPQAFAGDGGKGAQGRNQEEFQSHDRLILVDREAAGQAKTGFSAGLSAKREKIAFP
jgi:hypothetical protein